MVVVFLIQFSRHFGLFLFETIQKPTRVLRVSKLFLINKWMSLNYVLHVYDRHRLIIIIKEQYFLEYQSIFTGLLKTSDKSTKHSHLGIEFQKWEHFQSFGSRELLRLYLRAPSFPKIHFTMINIILWGISIHIFKPFWSLFKKIKVSYVFCNALYKKVKFFNKNCIKNLNTAISQAVFSSGGNLNQIKQC